MTVFRDNELWKPSHSKVQRQQNLESPWSYPFLLKGEFSMPTRNAIEMKVAEYSLAVSSTIIEAVVGGSVTESMAVCRTKKRNATISSFRNRGERRITGKKNARKPSAKTPYEMTIMSFQWRTGPALTPHASMRSPIRS